MTETPLPRVRIDAVRVQDFRAIQHVIVALDPLTALLGANNAGKTSFLDAIGVALGRHGSPDDRHVSVDGTRAAEFQVDVRFVPWEGDEFDDDAHAILADAIRPPDAAGTEYFVRRARGFDDPRRAAFAVSRCFLKAWEPDRDKAEEVDELPQGVGRDFGDLIFFAMLDARRDIVEDVGRRRSYWGQMAGELGLSDDVRDELETKLSEIGDEIAGQSPVLQAMGKELGGISDAIGPTVSEVAIRPVAGRVEDLVRGMDIEVAGPAGAPITIHAQGMGTRSLSSILIFRAFVRARLDANADRPLAVAAFEEPEAHLHPQAQRAVFDVIRDIPGQRLFSSHSAYVAGVADVHDYRVFSRRGGTIEVRWIPRTGEDGEPTYSSKALQRIQTHIQRHNGEILFARCVILMEGESEANAVPVFSQHFWGRSADAEGVSLVNCNGAGTAKHLASVLDRLGVPWLVLLDGDKAGDDALAALVTAVGRPLDAESPEVVQLPDGSDFDTVLLDECDNARIEAGLTALLGETGLDDFRSARHGQNYKKKRGGGVRDYKSKGWEKRLLLDGMKDNKGTYGRYVAEAIVEGKPAGDVACLPGSIQELFRRATDAGGPADGGKS